MDSLLIRIRKLARNEVEDTRSLLAAEQKGPGLFYVVSRAHPDDADLGNFIMNSFHVAEDGKSGYFGGTPMGSYPSQEGAMAEMSRVMH